MKSILLVALEYPPRIGGVEEYYRSLVEVSNEKIKPFVGEENLYWRFWPRWLPLLWRIPREMKKIGADVVFAGEVLPVGEALLFIDLLIYWFIGSFRYGVFVHGRDLALTGHKRWIARQVLKSATWVIANSEHTKKIALGYGLNPQTVHVLTPCPSIVVIPAPEPESTIDVLDSPIHRQGGASESGNDKIFRFLTVARFVERKGYDTAVAVASELKKRGFAFEWTFIGDGPDKKRIQDFVQSMEVSDSIRWLDAQSAEALAQEYQRADLFVFLPRTLPNGDVEGFGMVCLEAAFYGVPVIASNSGGVPEAIVDGITGIVTSPTDIQKIADDIIRLMKDFEIRKKMGEAGRGRVVKDFRWKDRCEEFSIIIDPLAPLFV